MYRKTCFRIALILLVMLAAGGNCMSQAPLFKNVEYDIERKGIELLTIFQEKRGPFWLGTSKGICRYDGITFKYLDKIANPVTAVAENFEGVLWVGHSNGSIEYIDSAGPQTFLPAGKLPKSKITALLFDGKKRLWIGTYGEGVYCYYNNQLFSLKNKDGLTDDVVYDLLAADNGTVWAATDRGISVCSISNGKMAVNVINISNGLPDNIVRKLKRDVDGNIWIALQDKGICYADKGTYKIIVPPETSHWMYGQVNDILPMKREIFIATEEFGIVEIHFGLPALNRMTPGRGKKLVAVQQLLLDRNEQVWVVADNTLSVANSNHFQFIEIPLEFQETIKALAADGNGKIWFANKKGIFTKDNNNSPVKRLFFPYSINYAAIVSLYADGNNSIWIGTYNNGLYRYATATRKITHYTKADGLIDNNIFSITGSGNEIWVGTLGGAAKLDVSTPRPWFQNFTRQNGLSNNFIYNVSIDSKNNKWFSTDGSGIAAMDKEGFHYYDSIPGLKKNIVYTTTEDIYGNIWFTGLNAGLFCFNGKSFTHFSLSDGLHDNDILNAVADDKGNLLLSHTDGLEIFNIRRAQFTFYGSESGFDNIKPELNAYCRTSKGAVLIGSSSIIILYYPADTRYAQLPQLVMNDVMLYFKSIGIADNANFNYDDNHITFDYAGLWYLNPSLLNYQYQLEGYSNEWINTKDHRITFLNLRPGNYVFRVKASINEDFRYAPLLTYRFSIAKPYWKTVWFRCAIVLLLGLFIYYLERRRLMHIQNKQQKEKERLTVQLAMLKNQLNPHFLFNSFNTLMNIIDNDKELAIAFTEKLSDFYKELALLQDKEMITVEEELNLLQHYIYLQEKRFGNNLFLKLNISNVCLQAFIPPLTLQLLAENALKHNNVSEENPLNITVESAQSFLIFSNNIHRKEVIAKSAGIGLKNIQKRVQLLTGDDVKIIETENEFHVIIPLKQ